MRRRAVLLGAPAALVGFAGCSALSSPSRLRVVVFNHTDSTYTVELALFREGEGLSRSEARVTNTRLDVEPRGQAERNSVAETGQYLVRYSVYDEKGKLTDESHLHYYPTDDVDSESLSFDIDAAGVLSRR